MPKDKKQQRLELLEAVLEGLRAAEKGTVVSHSKAMAELDKVLDATVKTQIGVGTTRHRI